MATLMQALDSTIANVALPHIQGSLNASQDQVAWVLTSYVIATAIGLTFTSFLVERFGRTRIYVIGIVGFTIASMLCGLSQSLSQIVLSRVLQGLFSACMVPLAQSVLMDLYPREKHGSVLSAWSMGVMVGPIIGPTLGGYLTDMYNWRWVFFINLPFGILAAAGLAAFLPETPRRRKHHFDATGVGLLCAALASLQLVLDRGQTLDWFSSSEIVIEAALFVICFYLYIVHVTTTDRPAINPRLFKNVTFATGIVLMFLMGAISIATMVLLPTMLQSLMNYPVNAAGLLMMPRGLGMMFAMYIVGRFDRKLDGRYLIFLGFCLSAWSMWRMSHFTLDVSERDILIPSVLQGVGNGFIFVPMNIICFASLERRQVTEAAALYQLMRSVGNSVGISVVVMLLAQNTQINHEILGESLTFFSRALHGMANSPFNLTGPAGAAMLNGEVERQAGMTAYVDNFLLMTYVTITAAPLVLLLRRGRRDTHDDLPVIHEA
jgi:DHA2 family multidrug resistance protein